MDKEAISTQEVITYLESVNSANASILGVLTRKPALPGLDQLEWVINSKIDVKIANKLKSSVNLSHSERLRLKETLKDVLINLKKLSRPRGTSVRVNALESYINSL